MTDDAPDKVLEETDEEKAIKEKLADRFKSWTFQVAPPVKDGEEFRCSLTVRRRPKDEWFKLKTLFPTVTTPQDDEQLLRQIERELMMWGSDGVRDREPDGAPQYPNLGRRY